MALLCTLCYQLICFKHLQMHTVSLLNSHMLKCPNNSLGQL